MKLKLLGKKDEAEGTKSFTFEPEKELKYIAGQYYYFTLPRLNYPDPRGATRHFTLSSSPTEGRNIMITTRVRQESGFKKTLDELKPGDIIEGEGPNGTFILNESNKSPQVFLTGGIGITPFRSIAKYDIDKNLGIPIYLLYSNSIPEQIAFKEEIEGWAKEYPNLIKVQMLISKPEEAKTPWTGLTGRIDANLISKFTGGLEKPTFWISGPPPMVDAMELALSSLGIKGDRIVSEKFTGY